MANYKLKNNKKIDSSAIIHNNENLNNILNGETHYYTSLSNSFFDFNSEIVEYVASCSIDIYGRAIKINSMIKLKENYFNTTTSGNVTLLTFKRFNPPRNTFFTNELGISVAQFGLKNSRYSYYNQNDKKIYFQKGTASDGYYLLLNFMYIA